MLTAEQLRRLDALASTLAPRYPIELGQVDMVMTSVRAIVGRTTQVGEGDDAVDVPLCVECHHRVRELVVEVRVMGDLLWSAEVDVAGAPTGPRGKPSPRSLPSVVALKGRKRPRP